ncbi:MAG TPA: ThiF family adenylyltransferase [Streptosporangiaceae bacterium]|nr:ThiF family adenylyltransferase [Streptosporangiaceae bacterium]
MTRKAAPQTRLSTWQREAIADLRAIADEHPGAVKVITATPTVSDTHAFVTIRLPTSDVPPGPGGLRLRDEEDFIVGIRQSRLVPPQVDVDHQRFAGHPHVLQGHRLCIYLDPAREWDPLRGMTGFLERLWGWLGDAAAGRFDAATAMYHAVGGVLHLTPGTPTIVIREQIPAKPFQRARLLSRSTHRLDMTFAAASSSALMMPVLTLSSGLPFGAGLTLTQLLRLIDRAGGGGPVGHTGLGPTPARAVLTSLAASATRNPDSTCQYFALAVPHPAGGATHLLVGRLPAAASDQMRQLAQARSPTLSLDPTQLSEDIPIEWCRVSDERPSVTTRRDAQRPVSAFQGKTVLIWGCGGIGSWVAEFITRAGAAKIILCDDAIVTGGLLVRQDYVEADIGDHKAHALAARIRAISDHVDVSTVTGSLSDLEDVINCADVIIDATVSIAVGQALAAVAAARHPHAVLAQLATDTSTGTVGILTVSAPSDPNGPAVIDTRMGRTVLADPALELYHALWQEPLDGHELTPTRGCSVPTFHGSAAELAAVAASLVNLLALHLTTAASGTHLIALPHAPGSGPHHYFIAA